MPVDALRAMEGDVKGALERRRQAEVLRLLERGRSTAQIADELQLSRETVRNHVRHLLHSLGGLVAAEAVALARGAAICFCLDGRVYVLEAVREADLAARSK